MRMVTLPGGERVAALGQGTWRMGEEPKHRREELAALRVGLDLGLCLIDTAEMYGEGGAEELVGEAVAGRRDEVFIVSKAYPQNASRTRLPQACERSLRRLGTDWIDLYLLHWRGSVPLAETVEAMQALQAAGKIRRWGVSNLALDDMAELQAAGGAGCATDQILYNLGRRGPELDLLPWLDRHGIPPMAYSPVEQGRLARHPALTAVAARHGVGAIVVALAWVLRRPGLIAIPKAARPDHVAANRKALELVLTEEDLAALEQAFPAPSRPVPLEML